MRSELHVIGFDGFPDVEPGMDLTGMVLNAAEQAGLGIQSGDILVVTQKIVSKAEGRLVNLATVSPSEFARHLAKMYDKDARIVEVVLRESKRVVKMDQGTIISETHHGFVCANAGVDESNVGQRDAVALLPQDPDRSALQLRTAIGSAKGVEPAVIISDTFGRPWRDGLVNVAIGVAGLEPIEDYRDRPDTDGRIMKVTSLAVADELASAAELVMGKLDRVPVALIRGYSYTPGRGRATAFVRPREKDLFR